MGKIIRLLKNKDFKLALFEKLFKKEQIRKKYPKEKDIEFIKRNIECDSDKLLIILAGFQPYYWDILLDRVYKKTKGRGINVCMCIPGVSNDLKVKLYEYCEKYGWDSAFYKEDRLAALQNFVIKKYDKAQLIFKIDEDIVIGDNFIDGLIDGLNYSRNNTRCKNGVVFPLINVNVFSYIPYLETIDKLIDFDQKFGRATYWSNDIQFNEKVAEYLWETLGKLSFDEMNSQIQSINKGKYIRCSQRYSIGAMLITRDFWDKMGVFRVAQIGQLGIEEGEMCKFALDQAYFMCCCCDTFVGHLGYGKQKDICKAYFYNNLSKFKEEC